MKKLLAYLLLAVLPLAASAQRKASETAVENLLLDGVCLLDEGQVKAARAVFELLKKEAPSNDAVHYYLGMCDYAEGQFDKAIENIGRAAALDTANLWYREALASAYGAVGKGEKTVEIYTDLLRRDPKRFTSPYTLSMMGDKALGEYKDSLALDYYGRALEADPDFAPALLGQAEVYRMKGNYPSFFLNLNAFVRNPEVVPAARSRYLDNLLRHVDPRTYRAWSAQLDSLIDISVRMSPSDSSMLKLAGQWYYGTSRKEKGREYFHRYAEQWPRDMSARLIEIQLLTEDKSYDEVLKVCEEMLTFAAGSDKVTVYSIMGDTYYIKGDRKKAYRAYEDALKLDPRHAPVLNNYAYYLSLERRQLKKAEKMSRTAIEAEPENYTFLDTYGWILHLMGRDEEARLHFKKSIVYGGSESGVILEHYSEVLRALGEKDLANYYKAQADKKSKK